VIPIPLPNILTAVGAVVEPHLTARNSRKTAPTLSGNQTGTSKNQDEHRAAATNMAIKSARAAKSQS
jgi:hypothetical protein